MPSFLLYTLGCKVNQYESQYVREGLMSLGFEEAGPGQKVDLCIINTCTVTAESDLKSRKIIRQCARRHPEAAVVVMGCYAARSPQELAALPGVVSVLRDKTALPEWLRELGLADPPRGISSFGRRHRAFVKIQDGCRQGCSYCIIPLVRPVLRSRPADEVLEEVRRLSSAGYREIVLTGIHLGHYGVDLPAPPMNLAQLVGRILKIEAPFRLRLSSLEVGELDSELVRWMEEYPDRFCPHLHLPLQSGSDRVLDRMGRPYGLADFLRQCDFLQSRLDHPALTTDILVGFPGETEQDHQATCRAVEQIGFSKLHVFPYSARPGTRAALLPERVPPKVVRRRCEELLEIGRQLRRRYIAQLVDRKAQILVEEVDGEFSEQTPQADSLSPARRKGASSAEGCKCPLHPEDVPSNRGNMPPLNGNGSFSEAFCGPQNPSSGEDVESAHLLRGTSERYVPVKLVGPRNWIGQLVTMSVESVVEDPLGEPALWASASRFCGMEFQGMSPEISIDPKGGN